MKGYSLCEEEYCKIHNNVVIVQIENRLDLDYFLLTRKINEKACNILNYDYHFEFLNMKNFDDIHPATAKIFVIQNLLKKYNKKYQILVFLDSDAWINDVYNLNNLINHLLKQNDKIGCFSRDPCSKENTFINSGGFIIKINEKIINIYDEIIKQTTIDKSKLKEWPWDQYYISKNILDNKNLFYIFKPDVLNTPEGKIIRHNWYKNKNMFEDLNKLLQNNYEKIHDYDFNTLYDIYEDCVVNR